MKQIGQLVFEAPKLKGTWIYIKGKIPKINENLNLKSLQELKNKKIHENEEKKKLMNIIKDDPESLLSKEQIEYFYKVKNLIKSKNPIGNIEVEGDILNLLPFLLKYIIHEELNENSIHFVLKMLENKYVWRNMDTFLKQTLVILLAYKGPSSFEVGIKIGELTLKFEDKYKVLYDIF
jgi:hypothetical protein